LQSIARPGQIAAMSLSASIRISQAPLLAFAGLGVFWGAFAAQVPVIKAGLGATDGAFGLALLCAAIGALLAMWVAPRFDLAVGARAMQVGAILIALAFLLPGIAPSLPVFGLAMFFCGASSGMLDVVMNARVTRLEALHSTGLMSLNHAVFSFAYAGSAFLTGWVREAGAVPGVVFACIGAGVALMSLRMVTAAPVETEDTTVSSGGGYLGVAIWTGLITLVAFQTEQSTESWSALHIERTFGGGAAEGAFGPTLLGLTMGAGRLAGHFATPRGRERISILCAALITSAGTALVATASTQTMAYLGFAILGLGVSVIAPLAIALAGQIVRPKDRALAVSRSVMVGYVGFFIGPPTMGFISEAFGLRASYGVIAALMLLSPLCLLPLRGRRDVSAGRPAGTELGASPATRLQTPSE
jgi:MFS family permease